MATVGAPAPNGSPGGIGSQFYGVASLAGLVALVAFVVVALSTPFVSDAQYGGMWLSDVLVNLLILAAFAGCIGFVIPWYWTRVGPRDAEGTAPRARHSRRDLTLGWGSVASIVFGAGLALLASRVASEASCGGISHGLVPIVCPIPTALTGWASLFGWVGAAFAVFGLALAIGLGWRAGTRPRVRARSESSSGLVH